MALFYGTFYDLFLILSVFQLLLLIDCDIIDFGFNEDTPSELMNKTEGHPSKLSVS